MIPGEDIGGSSPLVSFEPLHQAAHGLEFWLYFPELWKALPDSRVWGCGVVALPTIAKVPWEQLPG